MAGFTFIFEFLLKKINSASYYMTKTETIFYVTWILVHTWNAQHQIVTTKTDVISFDVLDNIAHGGEDGSI